jgi:ketosteroid isomerase-like protein
VSTHKAIVEKYIEGFRRSDHARILSCLTDDVVWQLHGYKHSKARTPSTPRSRTTGSRAARP